MKPKPDNKVIIAYAEFWSRVKKYTNKDGWCRLNFADFPEIKKEFNTHKTYWWRLAVLKTFYP